ncbi:MAG: tail fiber protein [Polyangiaceae bacterium]
MELNVRIDVTSPRWLRRAALLGLPVLAMAITSAAMGKQYTAGEVLKAADLNASFAALEERINGTDGAVASLVPIGTVIAYAAPVGANPPEGWLFCDGAEVNRTTYAKLFGVIGTTAGTGDGTTTFRLPDYRGRFLRGTDLGAGRDPDAAARTAMQTGGLTGDAVSTVESGAFKSHAHGGSTGGTHTPAGWTNAARDYSGGGGPTCAGFAYSIQTGCGNYFDNHGHDIAPEGGSETRPTNATVNYLIKI